MSCAICGRVNRQDARFCSGCGQAMVARCEACGRESAADAKFCDACGSPIAPRSAAKAETRKVVTIVFADLIGSTSLHERLDPESVKRVMERYHGAVRVPVEAHGGTVVQRYGDGVMCAFGIPRVAEDDAIRAVRAAVGIQESFREFVREHAEVLGAVGLRVAVNTGEVVVSDEYEAGIGDPLNVAARLQQLANDGDVIIGESTQRLVADRVTLEPFGVFTLKGRAESVAAYRVVSLERPAGVAATSFVGRDDELKRILGTYEKVVAQQRARMVVLLGSPGLGKSRLLDEVGRRLGHQALVLSAHCDSVGGSTFAPVTQALRTLLRAEDQAGDQAWHAAIESMLPADEPEAPRIAAGVGALLGNRPAPPEETFFVVRRFLGALARKRPVVLAIDDLHWAEPLLLDLTEHLVEWSTGAPLLVMLAARPELRDVRSSLTMPGSRVDEVVTLGGLDAAAATRLAANAIGAEQLPAALAGRVLATSEGNPLFVGELVRMLVQDGALQKQGEQWIAKVEVATLEMPPTIHALLAGRIERLRPEERTVLERAAVVGRQFSRSAVAELLPREIGDLDVCLEALRRSELIEPTAGWFLGEPVLRFHHVLSRDAAYRRLLKQTRAELHGRVADWIESRAGKAVEYDETIGWHLEQAHQSLRELGPLDDAGRRLGQRAAYFLSAAGRRALEGDDLPLASSLLGRAIERLEPGDARRADLALDWCEALLSAGDVGPAAGAVGELERFADGSDRLRAWHVCFAGQLAALTDPQALRTTADGASSAAEKLASLGDAAGEAKAHSVHALALSRLGKIGACEAALDRALAAARRAQDRRRANAVLAGAPLAALWGPSPVTRASGRCLDVVRVLRITQGAPTVEAVALRCQAVLEALRGRSEAARRMIASSRRMVEDLGITQGLLECEYFAGLTALIEGDTTAAEASLRAAYDGLREHGLGIDAARAAGLLGRTLLALDRAGEAEALSHESEALAGDDLQAAITWRRVRAEALAMRGEHAAAIELARTAVSIAAATDGLLHHAEARVALAAVLAAAGLHDEAVAEQTLALELWESKGATVLAERARRSAAAAKEEAVVSPAPAVEAVARVDEEPAPRARIENAATRVQDRLVAATEARDWESIVASTAPGCRQIDRRRLLQMELDRDQHLAWLRTAFDRTSARLSFDVLATRGDRLVLSRIRTAERDESLGPSENDLLGITEVNHRGEAIALVLFDSDELDAAFTELDERYAAGEGAPHERTWTRLTRAYRAIAARRWEDAGSVFAPDFTVEDHRAIGLLSTLSRDEFVASLRALTDLRTDAMLRHEHLLALDDHRGLTLMRWVGDESEGAFETPVVCLQELGAEQVQRFHFYDFDQLDAARAHFDALGEPRPDPLRIPPNAATRAKDGHQRALERQDWDALEALCAPTLEFDDRRRAILTTGGRDMFLASNRMIGAAETRMARTVLATAGDRLALEHVRWMGTDDGVQFDMESLALTEVDAEGRIVGVLGFDSDARRAASAEMLERYGRSHAAADLPRAVVEASRAMSVHDLERFRTLLSEDFVLHDHRHAGLGQLERTDYFASLGALLEQAAEVSFEPLYFVAMEKHGALVMTRAVGTLAAGGGAFEQIYALLALQRGDQIVAIEFFEPEDLERARARFAELRPKA